MAESTHQPAAPFPLASIASVPLPSFLPLVLIHCLLPLLHNAARLKLLPLHVPVQVDRLEQCQQLLCHAATHCCFIGSQHVVLRYPPIPRPLQPEGRHCSRWHCGLGWQQDVALACQHRFGTEDDVASVRTVHQAHAVHGTREPSRTSAPRRRCTRYREARARAGEGRWPRQHRARCMWMLRRTPARHMQLRGETARRHAGQPRCPRNPHRHTPKHGCPACSGSCRNLRSAPLPLHSRARHGEARSGGGLADAGRMTE